ncbi:MAG: DUF3445 domain-containing protein [Geminicoccaceae bacterium]|nr:DUF3445 domain-containing protein [Geminicoccaceae bacterium]MCX7629728.1 DUF3445 domain-containing protein [Geminicoccaceae bacterium]MDW8369048.1 DUF3445 domain-containing protein [Geminicoccaceae bacterium]
MRSTPLVFLEGPWKLAMGLRALDPADWLWLDERWEEEVAERRRLSRERRELVYAALPGSEPACAELLETVIGWLVRHAPERFTKRDRGIEIRSTGERSTLDAPEPLLAAGQLVQEDLLLLEAGPDGSYLLTAGHICFPLHWKLADKLGRSLRAIHDPVPAFGERLGTPTDRFFSALEVDRPVWRANWSLTSKAALCLPDRSDRLRELDPESAGQRLWLRVERQTLRRLPRSRAVVFAIKTRIHRLDEIAADPAVAGALAARIREMSDAMAEYKGLLAIRDSLASWLDARSIGAKELPTALG